MGTLYIVATPIGNLSDISERALTVLGTVDAVFCEDTRVTRKLLDHYDIPTRVFAYHQHSDEKVETDIARILSEGKSLALVSDAGTPGINDPGGRLIADLLTRMPDLTVVPIPGANAAVTALSVSGFPADRYQYWGFIPHKKGRQTFFSELAACEDTVVFYESKHRVLKTLQSLTETSPTRRFVVARELTKKFETLYRGTPGEILQALGEDPLGEFVIVAAPLR
ncbi:MAG TPA: 16S rRNA (cytidine(1402)-2'-O)-methyltransferase [Candidatus Paceibacterota bacterium]|nr:16S rRNA (cytidine(1402)-2'-O)-methyltransferase [Candidatus Paceibacterota bacterium]